MQKKYFFNFLVVLGLLSSCGGTTSNVSSSSQTPSITTSQTTTATSTSSGTSTSSAEEVIKTEALTSEMFAPLKEGYSVEGTKKVTYSDGTTGSNYFLEIKANSDAYDINVYTIKSGTLDEKNEFIHEDKKHYQTKTDEQIPMLYNVSLGVNNEPLYEQEYGVDQYTYQEIPLTWEEGNYSNAFAYFDIDDFTRVGEENKFSLNLSDTSKKSAYEALGKQLYGEEANDIESFELLTNGDKIVGYNLVFESYTSYDTSAVRSTTGKFVGFGKDVTSLITPLEGTEDPVFESAMDKLKEGSFEFAATQQTFNYESESFGEAGHWEGQSDGEFYLYQQYDTNEDMIFNYGYYDYVEDGINYLQGFVPINGMYYTDSVAYYDSTIKDVVPSFDFSSLLFIKDPASTADEAIYRLRKDIYISYDNNISLFTSFDSDSYYDALINLTITITDDSVHFYNSTADEDGVGGLIYDIVYSNIGKVSNLVDTDNIKEDISGLTWSDLLVNQVPTLESLYDFLGKEVLDAIPTFGTPFANVGVDVSSSNNPIFLTSTYSKEQGLELEESYGNALIADGFVLNETIYSKDVTLRNRPYKMNIELTPWWNDIQGWGQFQASLTITSR